ncbi:uncharacterized protein BT62DRAFT_248864 [Guyanagaster necrorhizus]|uniref:F-box domain-containing protein n=1 Tax=Guyanagaster necrorhizus TaxID=856835 RepID=A0A9P7VRC4_9AGAR|nr:uncharacterized protein BT62DRAFT_248864 [Guyanagaster necrorhizus MCA 3950]KAG7444566.1 hypothetical protein BT62DRAFT_248864 [Guyanagaster necrorhizus MCA 3950]
MLRENTCQVLLLPQEILDEILSEIDLHRDLISFALVSRTCTRLVIPRHNEYRIVRIRHKLPSMWAHLAKRADLARNIREVHVCERHNHSASDHSPTTLVPPCNVDDTGSEETRVQNMCMALQNMHRLRVFTWSCTYNPFPEPTATPSQEAEILGTLVSKPLLRKVALAGAFEARPGCHNSIYPLWNLTKLTHLSLVGRVWVRPQIGPFLKSMLKACPTIEVLKVPMELTILSGCVFPQLKKVNIFLQSGGTLSLDKSWVRFLEKNPTIEELAWFPLGPLIGGLSPDSLPRIRRVFGSELLLKAIYASPRPIECVETTAEPAMFAYLDEINADCLREVRFTCSIGNTYDALLTLAEKCPNITRLSFPEYHMKLDDWLHLFSLLPALEVFEGMSLWRAVDGNLDKMHQAIMQALMLCPNLRELDHYKYDAKRNAYAKIVILREEGEESDNVRYEVRRPPPRDLFDFRYSLR